MTRLWALVACVGCASHASEPQRETASPQGHLPSPQASAPVPASYADHISALRKRLHHKGLPDLVIRVEEPFVVVGNGTEEALERASSTVRW